jgi:DNA-binding HxlR family transcriptional regulator
MIKLHGKAYTCPVDVTLSRVGGKWKILILSHLYQFEKRSFSEVRKNLPGISEKMLNQQFKELQRDQLIDKNVLSEKPYRVEFFLTESGKSLAPMYQFLSEWGITFLKQNNIDYLKDQSLYKE